MPFANLLKSIHDAAQWLLHVILIPVIAVLNAAISGLTHLRDELAKA